MRVHPRTITLGALLLAALGSVPRRQADAQADAQAAPTTVDTAAVLAPVRALFDGMRAGDSTAVRAAFHPAALLASALVRDGQPAVQIDSIAAFAHAVGTPHPQVWDERLRRTTVHVDGPLAVVWAEYAFYAGTTFSHCGVDTFQLVQTPAGWRILALTDTRWRTGCPEQGSARP